MTSERVFAPLFILGTLLYTNHTFFSCGAYASHIIATNSWQQSDEIKSNDKNSSKTVHNKRDRARTPQKKKNQRTHNTKKRNS